MNMQRSKQFRESLRSVCNVPEPPLEKTFWDEFRARASLTVQETSAATAADGAFHVLSWRLVAAVATTIAILSAVLLFREPGKIVIAGGTALAPQGLSRVEEIEVFTDYSSVLIVEDAKNGGTVIWVTAVDSVAAR